MTEFDNIADVESSINEYQQQDVSDLAISLSTLLEAEEDKGLIKRSWRSRLSVDEMIDFIKSNTNKVENEWQREYKQLKKIVDYGGRMGYEEMMLILSLRSDLENGLRFVNEKQKELVNIDENLRDVLELNREHTRDCRNANRKNTGGLETYLTNHWWWRYDEENLNK